MIRWTSTWFLKTFSDDANIISRAPSEGARSQKPRTMKVGFAYKFLIITERGVRYPLIIIGLTSVHPYYFNIYTNSKKFQVQYSFQKNGAIAQLGEHLLCKQGVRGSIPRSSTIYYLNYHLK